MYKKFTSFLYYKIALLVMVFSISLIALIFFVVDYYYTDQDTILDAHEMYFYSQLISSWDFPSDSLKIKQDIINLQYNISIYSGDKNMIWSFPCEVDTTGYAKFVDSEVLGLMHNIKIPSYVSFGQNDSGENFNERMVNGNFIVLL